MIAALAVLLALACPEGRSSDVPAPTSVDVTLDANVVNVTLGRSDGFGTTWTATLWIDDGTVGGDKPFGSAPACSLQARYDWYIAGPRWFWAKHGAGLFWGDAFGAVLEPKIEAKGGVTRLWFDASGVPVSVGDAWLVTVWQVDAAGTPPEPRWRLAWSFTGTVAQAP